MAVPDWPNTYGYNLLAYPGRPGSTDLGTYSSSMATGFRVVGGPADDRGFGVGILVHTPAAGPLAGLACSRGRAVLKGAGGMRYASKTKCNWPHSRLLWAGFFWSLRGACRGDVARLGPGPRRTSGAAKTERLAVLTTFLAYGHLCWDRNCGICRPTPTPGDFRLALFFHLATALALVVHMGYWPFRFIGLSATSDRWRGRPAGWPAWYWSGLSRRRHLDHEVWLAGLARRLGFCRRLHGRGR